MTGRRENNDRRLRNLTRFRSPFGVPVACEIYVETDDDGLPEILSSIEVEGSRGNLILSQSEVDETEVLLMYRQWRRRPENQDLIRRVSLWDLTDLSNTSKHISL